ncbi:MAG TPA: hypothetical protein VMS65_08050, partial [Polyangiaceae bacterium]|nr:hypothetical protein [Polyangiaceae bacterium]
SLDRVPRLLFVGMLAVVATGLSWLYLAHYLGGGPRIIDAAAYFLEGRVLSTGQFAFDVPSPSASFRGRFLLPTPDGRLSVIFPPGYPLLLAAGFLVGAPLVIGPLLAGALVVATYATTRTLLGDERVARTAAVVSALCAALRYHTADTMSHGLSALLFTVAIGCAARRTGRFVVLAGLAAGWLVATRPVSGAAAAVLLLVVLRRHRGLVPLLVAGMLPGLVLFASHAHAATGSWFGSTQLSYYALADGPPGCFRYGFGAGVGCRFEHGDFVKEHLANGFGVLAASRVTIERLALHTIDVANLVPLALLVPWAAIRFRKEPNVLTLALAPLLVVLAYVPFYYPASYPGAGARLFADVLPLEHALLALALVRSGSARFAPGAMLLGFALHGVHQHVALAEREGGKPMFVSSALGQVTSGLVFVDTDHGFLLGHDPSSRDAKRGLIVARRRDDAHDRVLWERLGRPRSVRYDYDVDRGATLVAPYVPDASPLRFESEAEWPPLAVPLGWVHPDFRECLSRGQGLHLRPIAKSGSPSPSARVELELVPPSAGQYELSVGWLADPRAELRVSIGTSRASLVGASNGVSTGAGCFTGHAFSIELDQRARLTLNAADEVIVDYVELTPVETKKR